MPFSTIKCNSPDFVTLKLKTAEQIIDKISGFPRFPKEERLQRVTDYLSDLGNPHLDIKFVHVTGTNGKGSTCAMIASILQEAGYKVGLFSSPHLFDWRERIQINKEMISKEAVLEHGSKLMDFQVGIFEAWFLMAMTYFSKEKVDIVVLEAGIGGKLDTTNVIPSPEVSVLTNVGLEHTAILGATKEAIALDKAAIKKDSILVTGIEDPDLRAILPEHRAVQVAGPFWEKNEAVALEVIQVLREGAWEINERDIEGGLLSVNWPLRMEVIKNDPLVIVDVGHNLHGARAIREAIPAKIKGKRYLWMGISSDKDYEEMAAILSEGMDQVILSEAHYHAVPAEDLAEHVEHGVVMPDPLEAADYLIEHLQKEDQVYILGGLYFATDAVKALKNKGFCDDYRVTRKPEHI